MEIWRKLLGPLLTLASLELTVLQPPQDGAVGVQADGLVGLLLPSAR